MPISFRSFATVKFDGDPSIATWTLSSVGDGTIDGEITAIPADTDLSILRVKYRIYSQASPAEWTDGDDIATPAIGSTFQITGLANGTQYEVAVIAVDDFNNEGDVSNVIWATPTDSSPVAADGPYSEVMQNLADLVANSATFQAWTGTNNAIEAADYIHFPAVDEADITWPYALITPGNAFNDTRFAGGASDHYSPSGSLGLEFGAEVADEDKVSHRDSLLEFTNDFGNIIEEMKANAGSSGFIAVQDFRQDSPPMRASKDIAQTYKDYYFIQFTVIWGY